MNCPICNKELIVKVLTNNTMPPAIYYICKGNEDGHYCVLDYDKTYLIDNSLIQLTGFLNAQNGIDCEVLLENENKISSFDLKNVSFDQACKLFVKYSNLKAFI